jgi:GT2 family glycosyltransferase/glycosyltransferase involved in cell wall biosynthesis
MPKLDSRAGQEPVGVVDVIIPVYKGYAETRRCIESVLQAHCTTPFELVLVDDASPEPDLAEYCASLEDRPGVSVLHNPENLGFVATVNRGMRLHPERDVVLLNSDTEVANDWLDRLRRGAHSEADIGTVTPFSNNATICSYPNSCADNAMPEIGLAELDAVFAQANAGEHVDLPTAVGFCMYIKRACLDQVGLFDAGRFGRGYGEENDFSRRAAKAGWRNVLCADVFVFHAGGVSFEGERAALMAASAEALASLHPEYEALVQKFVAVDPPARYRLAVDIELARRRMGLSPVAPDQGRDAPKPVQLHVVHDLGGGIARWCQNYCQADEARINLVLRPWSQGHAMGQGLMLFAGGGDAEPLGFWSFTSPIPATVDTHPEYRRALDAIVNDYGVGAILVSSLIGHSLDALDTGLPTILVQHDFYPYCPAIHIYFQGVCQTCDAARLAQCAADNPAFNPAHRLFPVEERLRVRERYVDLVERRNLSIVVPSRSTREHFQRLLPNLDPTRFVTIAHGHLAELSPIPYSGAVAGGKLRIVVLGMLSESKGVGLLSEGMDRLLEFAEVTLLGAREMGELFTDKPGVQVISEYSPADLPAILAAMRPDVGLLLSVVPETFSYTLSELFMLGIPPAATRLGSFAERIFPGQTGYLFEPNVEAMLACLSGIHGDRETLRRIRTNVLTLGMRSAKEMVADYHRLLPLPGGVNEPAWLHRHGASGQAGDVMLSQALALSRQWREIRSLRLAKDMASGRLNRRDRTVLDLQAMLAEQEQSIHRLEGRLHEASLALVSRDHEIAALHASTSWKISSPVRWAGRRLRQGRILAQCLYGLLSRPRAMPARVWALFQTWRAQGMGGVKRRLRQWLDAANRPRPTPQAAPEVPAVAAVETDWRMRAFQHYRESFTDSLREAIRARIQAMDAPPLISVLVPTYNTKEPMLREMLDSMCAQLYPYWQLCVADDASSEPHVRSVLEEYAARDVRIRLDIAAVNGGVSRATNRALAMAEGDFVVLLDHDDLLEEQALFRVAEAVLADDPDMLYSDEVLVGEDGKSVQHFIFRPMFSPEYLRCHPYIVHLIGFRASLLRALGGLDETLRISQDYDLILRASERAATIVHIPEMLYRWRIHGGSAGHEMIHQVMEASSGILRRHVQRWGEEGVVGEGKSFNYFDVRYPLSTGLKVAIIVPTRNHADLVRACIESIERTVGDIAHELVLIDHESDDPDALAYFDSLRSRVTLLRYGGAFNFAAINNWAVAQLDGSHTHYLFCNNDVEAIEAGWLQRMLELGQKADVGIVGAKLYYPDGKTIQHAGVVVGCCGVAENLGRFRRTSDATVDLGYIGSLICNREVSAVTAACLLIRGTVFKEIGGFDESIAVGYGDVDLCLRAGEHGYRTLFCAHAELLHHESFTRGRRPEDPHPEDSARFLARWRAMFESGDPYFNPNLSQQSPNWQVADPLEFALEIRRRIFRRGSASRA